MRPMAGSSGPPTTSFGHTWDGGMILLDTTLLGVDVDVGDNDDDVVEGAVLVTGTSGNAWQNIVELDVEVIVTR